MRKLIFLSVVCGLVMGFQANLVWAATPAEQMAQELATNNGQTQFSVRTVVENKDHISYMGELDENKAHQYLILNSLGKSPLTPVQLADAIKSDLDRVFPIDAIAATDDHTMRLGDNYSLNLGAIKNPVRVTAMTRWSFTLETLPGHTFKGTATHSVIKDGAGELWMMQQGKGTTPEFWDVQVRNALAADVMWTRMAAKTRDLMDHILVRGGAFAGLRYDFRLNGRLNTKLLVRKGEKLTFQAEGRVTFGFFAGTGGPRGIQFGTFYNIFNDINHGALTGGVGDDWFYVGEGTTVLAPNSKSLVLLVNDSDPNNNSGAFNVTLTIDYS